MVDNDKKMKRAEALGAKKFRKCTLALEKAKFKVLKLVPNYLEKYEKYCDKQQKKLLAKATSVQEKDEIKARFKVAKMRNRKEYYSEQNRNYHIDSSNPTEILKYLNWNRDVHVKGLKSNAIIIPGLILALIFNSPLQPLVIASLIYELIGAAINFECINLQDYNIARIEKIKDKLEKLEKKKIEKKEKEYGEAAKVIVETVKEKEQLPSIDEIIDNVQTKEQLEQMKKMILAAKSKRQKETPKELKKGGMNNA